MRLFPTASQLQRVLPNVQDLSICLVGLRLAVMSGSNLLLGLQFLNPSLPKAGAGACNEKKEVLRDCQAVMQKQLEKVRSSCEKENRGCGPLVDQIGVRFVP